MLTGDNEAAAAKAAGETGMDKYYSGLLPEEKVEKFTEIKKSYGGYTAFAGDGINDAPVLALSDAGIAMGNLGSDAAIETADIVLMTDAPSKIAEAVKLSRKTKTIVTQNIVFALGVKVLLSVWEQPGLPGCGKLYLPMRELLL